MIGKPYALLYILSHGFEHTSIFLEIHFKLYITKIPFEVNGMGGGELEVG